MLLELIYEILKGTNNVASGKFIYGGTVRARNLKPGFFKSEQILKLKPLSRILFQGLWCMADRVGRVEDRPFQIKLEVLPNDKCNVDKILDELVLADLICRYTSGGKRVIWIMKFLDHQNPHYAEKESKLPPFDAKNQPALDKTKSKPSVDGLNPDSCILNPDSCILNPDSCILIPESGLRVSGAFAPPTPKEAEDYATSIGFKLDGEAFIAYYEKTGWMIKGQKIKRWQSCVVTWKKNEGKFNGRKNSVKLDVKDPERAKQYAD